MVIFFHFDTDIETVHQEIEFAYEHRFSKVDNPASLKSIYFSTPSDFHNHLEEIKKSFPASAYVVFPEIVQPHMPEHIGFQKLESVVEKYRGKDTFKLAILNAMSNAIGDHLIGMQAFDYFYEKLQALLPETKLEISLYQINPYRLGLITKQWQDKYSHIYMLPNKASQLASNDAFIDLGSLILRESFDTQPMIDFFLEALSIDPQEVPPERKRMKFKTTEHEQIKLAFNNIRLQGRPILLFHHTSTSGVRQMTELRARKFLSDILTYSDYFVVSADYLDFSHKRFRNLNYLSRSSIDNFASVISHVDAVISVDTVTYHLADAFDIPTVVLFTTIEPDRRIRYYPRTAAIMLEDKNGRLYGKHKDSSDPNKAKSNIDYLEGKWSQLDIQQVLQLLEKQTKLKQPLEAS
jgi:hypothetical protein